MFTHLCLSDIKLFKRSFVLGCCLLLPICFSLAEGCMDGLIQVLFAQKQRSLPAAIRVDRQTLCLEDRHALECIGINAILLVQLHSPRTRSAGVSAFEQRQVMMIEITTPGPHVNECCRKLSSENFEYPQGCLRRAACNRWLAFSGGRCGSSWPHS